MLQIESWLSSFKESWMQQDIERVLTLFTDDVEYWETPFQKFENKSQIADAWKYIEKQQNISMIFDILHDDTVRWNLKYDIDSASKHWSGVYVIRLNSEGVCKYFWQCGEENE